MPWKRPPAPEPARTPATNEPWPYASFAEAPFWLLRTTCTRRVPNSEDVLTPLSITATATREPSQPPAQAVGAPSTLQYGTAVAFGAPSTVTAAGSAGRSGAIWPTRESAASFFSEEGATCALTTLPLV